MRQAMSGPSTPAPHYEGTASHGDCFTFTTSQTGVPGTQSGLEASPCVPPGSRSIKKPSRSLQRSLSFQEPIFHQGSISHQSSTIHAEWCQSGGPDGDHVQLSIEEPLPGITPESSCEDQGSGGNAGQPEDDAGGAWPRPHCCYGTLTPVVAYMRLFCWLALLFAGYGFQRGLCAAGLPYDCKKVDAADIFSTLTTLAFAGGALGWLAGVTRPARFAWLASPWRCYLWLAFAVMLPAYSGISTIPAMHSSLTNFGHWDAATIGVITTVAAIVFAALAFHIWLALHPSVEDSFSNSSSSKNGSGSSSDMAGFKHRSSPRTVIPSSPGGSSRSATEDGSLSTFDDKLSGTISGLSTPHTSPVKLKPRRLPMKLLEQAWQPARRGPRSFRALLVYLLPRLAVLLYFIVWFAVLAGSGAFDLHLHHYALGWALASLAAFNHPVSGMLLALGTAVFVQGAGSYGFDPFLEASSSTGGCLNVTSPQTGQMTCAFWSATPFNLSFCSDTNWIPWFDCSVEWPWPETKITPRMMRMGMRHLNITAPMPLLPEVPLIVG